MTFKKIIHQSTSTNLELELDPALQREQLTMPSHDIARLTGKRHEYVMRNIQKIIKDLNLHTPDLSGTYKTSQGNEYRCFNLPKRELLILIAGYSIEERNQIIGHWLTLERQANHDIKIRLFEYAVELEKENRALQLKLDEVIRSKAQINTRSLATAMGTASAAKRETQQLKNKLRKILEDDTLTHNSSQHLT